jgi:hypothetical protein
MKHCKVCKIEIDGHHNKYCQGCRYISRRAKDILPENPITSRVVAKMNGNKYYFGNTCIKCNEKWRLTGSGSCLKCTREAQFEKSSARMKEVNAEKRELKINLGYKIPTKEARKHMCDAVFLNYGGDNCYGELMF